MKNKKKFIIAGAIIIIMFIGLFYLHKKTGIFYRLIYGDIINHYSDVMDLDPLLVSAVMRKESGVNHIAVSRKGAVGLMQIMPATGRELAANLRLHEWSDEKLKNPEANIMLGTYYLKRLMRRYDNDLVLALGAYNAGIGNIDVVRFVRSGEPVEIEHLPFNETRQYVKSVLFTYNLYKFLDKLKQIPLKLYKEITE